MKLVAIWIEDYKIIKNKYFNFEDEFQFDFEFIDVERKLKITKKQREKYYHLFNEPIYSFTGIIGTNGCGKTSILTLLNVINYNQPLTHNVVLIFKDIEEYQIVCYSSDNYGFFPEKKINIITNLGFEIKYEQNSIFEKVNFIHYSSNFGDQNDKFINPNENLFRSNQFQILHSLDPERIRDYLDKYEFKRQNKDILAEESFNILKLYYNNRLERQISFLSRVNSIDSPIKEIIKEVKFPEKITIWFQSERILKLTNQLLVNTLYKKFGIIKEIIEYAETDPNNFSNYQLNTDGLKNRFKNQTILFSFLYVWSGDLFVNDSNNTILIQIEEQVSQFKVDETIYQQILDFMTGYEGKSVTMKLSKVNILLKELDDNLKDVEISQNIVFLNNQLSYEFKINNNIWKLLKCLIEVGFSYDSGLINYSWGNNFSSGEEAMLTQFTELEYALQFTEENNKDILVTIDEGETYFHPEWQRNYINLLVKFFSYYLKKNDGEKKLQIILTSHSPFIVSDLTPNNLIVISKSGETSDNFGSEQTFGANIYDLLANNFFLENGFMGEFAKRKIESLIDFLESDQKELNGWNFENAKAFITLIGEPFLQTDLEFLLVKKRETEMTNDEIDAEINRLIKLKK